MRKKRSNLPGSLKELEVDLIDCSCGGLVPDVKMPVQAKYQVPFSEKIRKEGGIMTGAVGLLTTSEEAEEVLQKEQADLILLGRELLRNPYFPLEAAAKMGAETDWPPQYLRAKLRA